MHVVPQNLLGNPAGDWIRSQVFAKRGISSATTTSLTILDVAAMLPRPAMSQVVQAGTNVTIAYNALGPVVSSTASAGGDLGETLAMLPRPPRVEQVRAGAGITLTRDALGPIFSASAFDTDAIPQTLTIALARGNLGYWAISPGAANAESFGMDVSTSVSAGSFAIGTIAGTSLVDQSARFIGTSAAGAGSSAYYCFGKALACVRGGFDFAIRGIATDAATVANSRGFMGLRAATAAPGNVEPSSLVDMVGLGSDAGETELSIMHNDSSGTATKVGLGANFPAQTLGVDLYKLSLHCLPGASTIKYHVLRENTGHTASGDITTNLPTSGTLMVGQWFRNNGTTALAVKLGAFSQWLKWNLEA